MRRWIWFLDPDSAGFSIDFKTSEMLSSLPFRVFLCRRRMRLHCDERASVTEIPVGVFLEGKRIRLTNAPPSSGEGAPSPRPALSNNPHTRVPYKSRPPNFSFSSCTGALGLSVSSANSPSIAGRGEPALPHPPLLSKILFVGRRWLLRTWIQIA
jgi:hypothetical protein